MKKIDGGIWIDYEFKNEYQDSSLNGLVLNFSKELKREFIVKITRFIDYLQTKYYFPIRCNLYFENVRNFFSLYGKRKTKGIFLFGDAEKKTFPSIYVSCKITSHWSIEDVYYSTVKLLTYYFQWYFFQENSRTNRSLEIEATKYANYLVNIFLYENNINN